MKQYIVNVPDDVLKEHGFRYATNHGEIHMFYRNQGGNVFITNDGRVMSFNKALMQALLNLGFIIEKEKQNE